MRQSVLILCLIVWLAGACANATSSSPSGPQGATGPPAPTVTAATSPSAASTAPVAAPSTLRVASGTVTVEMGDHFFNPAQTTIAVGTTVVWIHHGQSAHDVTALDGSFASSTMVAGGSFSYTFTRPGRYPYTCIPHAGDGMVGEVVVQ